MAALVLPQSKRNTGYDKSAVEVDPSQPAFTRRREVCTNLFHPRSLALLLFIGASQQMVLQRTGVCTIGCISSWSICKEVKTQCR